MTLSLVATPELLNFHNQATLKLCLGKFLELGKISDLFTHLQRHI